MSSLTACCPRTVGRWGPADEGTRPVWRHDEAGSSSTSTKQDRPYAAVMVTGGHGVRMQYNYVHDIAASRQRLLGISRWLRLTRTGTPSQVTSRPTVSDDHLRHRSLNGCHRPCRSDVRTSPQYAQSEWRARQRRRPRADRPSHRASTISTRRAPGPRRVDRRAIGPSPTRSVPARRLRSAGAGSPLPDPGNRPAVSERRASATTITQTLVGTSRTDRRDRCRPMFITAESGAASSVRHWPPVDAAGSWPRRPS